MSKKSFTTIRKDKREKIVAQALSEISFARDFKTGKTGNWSLNEQLYYGNLPKSLDSRANVDLARMQEFVHTLLSKIDSPLTFRFRKRKDAQTQRVERLNALQDYDNDRDFWSLKDIAGKKQMVIYGRAIFAYTAHSLGEGYRPDLQNVDVYKFLIDPSAGGLDINRARFLGDYGTVLSRADLEAGSKAGIYVKDTVKDMLLGTAGNNDEDTEEENRTKSRTRDAQRQGSDTEKADADKFKFWRWGTTFEGERYYVLMTESGQAVQVTKLSELFSSNLWWYWTYAAYPDLTEFWTPSPADYVRELFMAQAVSINQMIDNAEKINKPQKIVDVTAVQSLGELKWRKDGIIRAKAGLADKAVKILETPSINTPLAVFDVLEQIQQRASGVTDQSKGVSDTDGRATIYEGNQQATADRFGLFNKSYGFGYKTFAKLWEHGVRDHMTKKISIDLIGPEGVQLMELSRRDVIHAKDEFGVIVESSNVEMQMSAEKKRFQTAFLGSLYGNPEVDQKDLIMEIGRLTDMDTQTMHQLLDKSEYGDAEVRGEAARDVETIIEGVENVKPNRKADTSYMQYIKNYMEDNEENLTDSEFNRLVQYMESLQEVVVQNMTARAANQARQEASAMTAEASTGAPTGGQQLRAPGQVQPLQDVLEQNVRK